MTSAPATTSKRGIGIWYLVLSAVFFSLMSLLVKLAGRRLPSQHIVAVRVFITFLLSLAMVVKAGVPMFGTHKKLLFLRGFFGFLGLNCFYYSLTHLPLAEATVIQYVNPVLTALLATIFLGERFGWWLAASIGMSLTGVVVMARPGFLFGTQAASFDPLAVTLACAGAVFSACAYVTVRKLSRIEHELVIVFYFPLVALPASLPTTLAREFWPTPMEWLILLGIGVSTQIAQIMLTRGMKYIEAGKAVAVMYLQIMFAAIWGVVILNEPLSAFTMAGSLLILTGTVLAAQSQGEKSLSTDAAKAAT